MILNLLPPCFPIFYHIKLLIIINIINLDRIIGGGEEAGIYKYRNTEVSNKIYKEGFNYLPVIDKDKKILGVIISTVQ